jgi:serine/threonine protein kinase
MGNKQSRKVDFSKFEANPSAPKKGLGAYDLKVIENLK